MRLVYGSTLAIAIALVVPTIYAQGQQPPMDASRSVAGGGITAPGWKGRSTPTRKRPGSP